MVIIVGFFIMVVLIESSFKIIRIVFIDKIVIIIVVIIDGMVMKDWIMESLVKGFVKLRVVVGLVIWRCF